MRILVLCLWCLLAVQGVLAEEKIAKTTVENYQFQKQDSGFIEVDFPALFEEYKTNKAEMTKFAFKAWWKKVNDTLEVTYIEESAVIEELIRLNERKEYNF